MYLTENPDHQQANYKDSTVNDDIVVNKWDAIFLFKIKYLKYLRFWLNKISPERPPRSLFFPTAKHLNEDKLVIRTSEIGNWTFW